MPWMTRRTIGSWRGACAVATCRRCDMSALLMPAPAGCSSALCVNSEHAQAVAGCHEPWLREALQRGHFAIAVGAVGALPGAFSGRLERDSTRRPTLRVQVGWWVGRERSARRAGPVRSDCEGATLQPESAAGRV